MIPFLSQKDMVSISKSAERTEARLEKALAEITRLKEQKHNRNALIKKLREEIERLKTNSIDTRKIAWKCFTCGQIYAFSTLEPLKNVIPSCFCSKPDCRIIINR